MLPVRCDGSRKRWRKRSCSSPLGLQLRRAKPLLEQLRPLPGWTRLRPSPLPGRGSGAETGGDCVRRQVTS